MSVEQQVDALATSVENLKSAVVSKKATLDASVVDAQSATAQAQNAKTNALSARDQAGTFKDAAYVAAQSAASAVAYQDLTALAATKDFTAVDVFIYDTAKDSDGGAWRHRCAGTSWYREPLNTATRGSRREFPAVAVIVAEANKVTIYDGDDPSLPMWMIFNGAVSHSIFLGYSSPGGLSVTMRDGNFCVGTTGISTNGSINGLAVANFGADSLSKYDEIGFAKSHQGVVDRNDNAWSSGLGWWSIAKDATKKIVNQYVNDVAVVVLPGAPNDPATGLPLPTIAVATNGGVSVIKHDGNVWDITGTNWGNISNRVGFVGEDLYFDQSIYILLAVTASNIAADHILYDRYDIAPFRRVVPAGSFETAFSSISAALDLPSYDLAHFVKRGNSSADSWLTLVKSDPKVSVAGMAAFLSSTFNTGWMPGAIRGAWLAETDDTDLVAAELVTNGTFDIDAFEWAATGGAGLSSVAGNLKINNDIANFGGATQTITTVPGSAYVLCADIEIGNTSVTFRARNEANFSVLATRIVGGTGPVELHFVAISTATQVQIINADSTLGDFSLADNISVRPADADRSVNRRGLVVNGTITRAPVEVGAELIAYSGFSEANSLEGTDASYDDSLYALGWQQTNGVWEFKHGIVSAAPIDGLTITGTTLKIAGTKPKALVRVTTTTPPAAQLVKIEQEEGALFQVNAACTLYGASDAVTALAARSGHRAPARRHLGGPVGVPRAAPGDQHDGPGDHGHRGRGRHGRR